MMVAWDCEMSFTHTQTQWKKTETGGTQKIPERTIVDVCTQSTAGVALLVAVVRTMTREMRWSASEDSRWGAIRLCTTRSREVSDDEGTRCGHGGGRTLQPTDNNNNHHIKVDVLYIRGGRGKTRGRVRHGKKKRAARTHRPTKRLTNSTANKSYAGRGKPVCGGRRRAGWVCCVG